MKLFRTLLSTAGFLLLVACASTQVATPQPTPAADTVSRPERVIVHDFVGTPGDLPPDSAIAQFQEQQAPQTPQQIELGRKLGRLVADNVVAELNAAGITAQRADTAGTPKVGDGVIRGEFVVANEGSRTKRVLIGFGAGAANLQTLVEAYVVTAEGLRPLGSTQVAAGGGKLPGVLVPVGMSTTAATAATSGASNVMQERGPESLDAAAKRTAKGIAQVIIDAYKRRGWMS